MFVDNIRAILNPGTEPDYKKSLLQQYADSFKKSSAAISEWTAKKDCSAEIRNEAWNLFGEYCRTVLELAVSNGKKDVCELEYTQPIVKGFLSVLFPGEDYADEINSRLNYIAKRAFDSAWSRNSDSFSPMDSVDSFRRMLSFQLEQTSDLNRIFGKTSHGNDTVSSIRIQLLEIVYDLSRYQPDQREYRQLERLHDSALGVLKEIGRKASPDAQPQFKFNSAWEIHAALKHHVQLTEADSSVRRMNPTWETVCSLKAAVGKTERHQEKQQSQIIRSRRSRNQSHS